MTNLMRFDPWRELEEMSNRWNRMLSRPETKGTMMTTVDWAPLVDVKETNEEYLIKAELPGLKKEDVKVAIDHGHLTLTGERKLEKEEKGEKYHRVERFYGNFMRSFTLPEGVDENKVIAEHKDGVLTVRLPKSPVTKPKAIDVKIS